MAKKHPKTKALASRTCQIKRHPNGDVLLLREADGTWRATDSGLEALSDLARAGHNLASAAATLGISRRTLFDARQKQPEIDQALAVGHEVMQGDLTSELMRRIKHYPQIPTYLIYALKSLVGVTETQAAYVVKQAHVTNNILAIGQKFTTEQLAQMIGAPAPTMELLPQASAASGATACARYGGLPRAREQSVSSGINNEQQFVIEKADTGRLGLAAR